MRDEPKQVSQSAPTIKRGLRSSFRFSSLLARPSSGEEVHDIVVVFVARVLVHLLGRVDFRPRNDGSPRFRPGCRVLDREFVINRVRIDTAEAFGNFERGWVRILKD